MKYLFTILFATLTLGLWAQVSKTNSTQGTITSIPANGTHMDRTFVFSSGDFGGCTSLTEVTMSLRLVLGSGTPCNAGTAYGVHEDLNVRLVSPTGTIVDLVQDRWGYWTGNPSQSHSFNGFTAPDATVNFDDDFATNIQSVNDWQAGNFAPHNPLSAFDGENPVGTWTLRISDGNSQFAPSDFVCYMTGTLTIACGAVPGTWDGSTSTDWNTASNWSADQVPTASDNVTIPSAPSNQPHVTSSPASPAVCNNLTVDAGATLTIDAGKALTASGATANAGTIIVKADATGIGSFIDNGTISGAGSFQMEQYLTGSGGGTPDGLFYYVSSPIPNATAATYGIPSANKLWIDDEPNQSYPELTFGAIPLEIGQGYITRMGSTGAITFNGSSYNTGDITEGSLTRTGTTATYRGYNLVGNPYPSTVSWDNASRTNLETTMYYRTHNGSTMLMDTYNATGMVGTSNNGSTVTGNIAPTQSFWVRVPTDGQTGSLTFENADRSHGTLTGILKTAAEEGTLRLTLSDGNVSDEQIILFNPTAQGAYDDFDSQKFWSTNIHQLYSTVGADTLTINGLNNPISTPTVDLGMKIHSQGNYTLNATSITFTETPVYLEDTELNVFQDLNLNATYSFSSNAGNIGDRFVLHFSEITGISEAENNINVFANSNIIYVILSESTAGNIKVLDMSGRVLHTQPISSDRTTIDLNSSSGIYVVQVETSTNTITKKVTIQ